jgi:thioredoxin-related protein
LFAFVLGLALARTIALGAADEPSTPWNTDFAAASAQARKEDRAILLNFTGSDWCVWCHRLRDEVFVQPAFLDFAAAQLVLVEVDFPQRQPLPDTLAAQNQELDERFGVTGYPTIILLNSAGSEIGRLGYMQGGAKTFVRELKRLIAAAPGGA